VVDAEEVLATLLSGATVDRDHVVGVIQDRVGSGLHKGQPIRVYDEVSARLWLAGFYDATLLVEEGWQVLAARYQVAILCVYPMSLFEDSQSQPFLDLCARHTEVSFLSESGPLRTPCPV
jgi:hypothetical protein